MRLIQGALDAGVKLAEVFIDTVGAPPRQRERIDRVLRLAAVAA